MSSPLPSSLVDLADGPEVQLSAGLPAELAAWGFGTWHPSGEYSTDPQVDPCPIVLGPNESPSTPDERLLVTVRPGTPDVGRLYLIRVGFNYRGQAEAPQSDPLRVIAALHRRLHRLRRHTFGALPVGGVLHESSGLLGYDSARRPGASATYLFRVLVSTANG